MPPPTRRMHLGSLSWPAVAMVWLRGQLAPKPLTDSLRIPGRLASSHFGSNVRFWPIADIGEPPLSTQSGDVAGPLNQEVVVDQSGNKKPAQGGLLRRRACVSC